MEKYLLINSSFGGKCCYILKLFFGLCKVFEPLAHRFFVNAQRLGDLRHLAPFPG